MISPGAHWLVSYDPATGKEYWRVRHGQGFSIGSCPVYGDGLVLFSTGCFKAQLLAVRVDGEGDVAGELHEVHAAEDAGLERHRALAQADDRAVVAEPRHVHPHRQGLVDPGVARHVTLHRGDHLVGGEELVLGRRGEVAEELLGVGARRHAGPKLGELRLGNHAGLVGAVEGAMARLRLTRVPQYLASASALAALATFLVLLR